MTAEPAPAPYGPEKTPLTKPTSALKAAKKPSGKKLSKKPAAKDLNNSEEIRKIATKMKAGGQKVLLSLIVQELVTHGIKVAPAQVSMVLRRMGFKPLRKRKSSACGESKVNAPAQARKVPAVGIEDLLASRR